MRPFIDDENDDELLVLANELVRVYKMIINIQFPSVPLGAPKPEIGDLSDLFVYFKHCRIRSAMRFYLIFMQKNA